MVQKFVSCGRWRQPFTGDSLGSASTSLRRDFNKSTETNGGMGVRLSGGRPRAKEQRLRTRAVGLLTAAMVVGGLLASPASPAAAQLSATPFTAYGAGDA